MVEHQEHTLIRDTHREVVVAPAELAAMAREIRLLETVGLEKMYQQLLEQLTDLAEFSLAVVEEEFTKLEHGVPVDLGAAGAETKLELQTPEAVEEQELQQGRQV